MTAAFLRRTRPAAVLATLVSIGSVCWAQSSGTVRSERNRPSENELRDVEATRGAIEALGESPIAAVLAELGPDVQLYQQHVMTLANPFFEGRAPGTAGIEAAADYLEFYLRRAGLEPVFPKEVGQGDEKAVSPRSSYRQPMRAGRHTKLNEESLVIHPEGGEPIVLRGGRDFNTLGMSGSGELRSAPIVFAGYSVLDGEDGYSNYDGGDELKDRIALIFRFEPMTEDGRSRWVERGWSPASGLDLKLANAAEAGAAAILLVNPPGVADPRGQEMMDSKSSIGASRPFRIPILMVSTEAADRIVRASTGSPGLVDLRRRADEGGVLEELPGLRGGLKADIVRGPVMSDNVAGLLPGRGGLRDEYIVIGAHYDHVGYGPTGVIDARNMGKLHPGADDNASGTSGVLILAEKLAGAYAALPENAEARSIIFIGFTAEEGGLNGSRHFVNNPPVPLEAIDLMINMDMIGRLRESKLDVDGVQSAEGFYDWLKPFFDESGLTVKHGFSIPSNSDHYSFYAKNIPILNLFTGFHREYHRPEDQAHLINAPGAVRALTMVERITLAAAQRPERLKFTPARRRNQPAAEERGEQAAARPAATPAPAAPVDPHAGGDGTPSPGPVAGRVRFGIAPGDYSDDEPGVLVGEVYEGTSAADAGIKVGDRMIRWNGTALTDVGAWMPLLSGAKVGDVVEVVVVRGGQEVPIKVTLKAREQAPRN
jgi:hypothetical protein